MGIGFFLEESVLYALLEVLATKQSITPNQQGGSTEKDEHFGVLVQNRARILRHHGRVTPLR